MNSLLVASHWILMVWGTMAGAFVVRRLLTSRMLGSKEKEWEEARLFQGQIQVTQLPLTPSSVLKVPLPPSSVTGREASLQQGFGDLLSLWLQQFFTVSLWSTNGSRGLVLVFSSWCMSPDSSPGPACSQGLLVAQAVMPPCSRGFGNSWRTRLARRISVL